MQKYLHLTVNNSIYVILMGVNVFHVVGALTENNFLSPCDRQDSYILNLHLETELRLEIKM